MVKTSCKHIMLFMAILLIVTVGCKKQEKPVYWIRAENTSKDYNYIYVRVSFRNVNLFDGLAPHYNYGALNMGEISEYYPVFYDIQGVSAHAQLTNYRGIEVQHEISESDPVLPPGKYRIEINGYLDKFDGHNLHYEIIREE